MIIISLFKPKNGQMWFSMLKRYKNKKSCSKKEEKSKFKLKKFEKKNVDLGNMHRYGKDKSRIVII